MKQSILDQVLGRMNESATSDVVPVVANVPQHILRRRAKERKRGRKIGEAEEDVIPDDAEELTGEENVRGNITTPLPNVPDPKTNPLVPKSDEDLYVSPLSAVTAPDATPQAMTPVDPSQVPGASTEEFTASQLPKEPQPSDRIGADRAAEQALQMLSRRKTTPEEPNPMSTAPVTAESFQATINPAASAEALLTPGGGMPDHKAGDGSRIFESMHKFV